MEVVRLTNKKKVSRIDSVEFQLITLLFEQKIYLNQSDIMLLTLLGLWGSMDLTEFCEKAADKVYKDTESISARIQNVRNRLVVLERKELVVKELVNKKKKTIRLTNTLPVVTKGNVLLDFNFITLDSN